MSLITRTSKGAPLTYSELDGNIAELDRRTEVGWQNLRGQITYNGVPNPPSSVAYNGVYLPSYDPDNIQECSVIFHPTHDYVVGSDLYPHGHTLVTGAASGVVRWGFTFIYANEADAFSSPVTAYVEQTIVAGDADKHKLIETPTPLSIPTLSYDSIMMMRVWRDANHVNDTYPSPIFLYMVDLYYQSQKFGTVAR
jgi:hypothetical protein